MGAVWLTGHRLWGKSCIYTFCFDVRWSSYNSVYVFWPTVLSVAPLVQCVVCLSSPLDAQKTGGEIVTS